MFPFCSFARCTACVSIKHTRHSTPVVYFIENISISLDNTTIMIDNYNANTSSYSKEMLWNGKKYLNFGFDLNLFYVIMLFFSNSFKSVHSPWVLKFTFQIETLMNIIGNVFRIRFFFFSVNFLVSFVLLLLRKTDENLKIVSESYLHNR